MAEERNKFATVVSSLNEHGTWVLKEPRLCLLLPVLQECLTSPVCVHICRNPLEVARSLQTRNGFSIAAGLALWDAYNRRALSASENLPRVLLSYDALALRPMETLDWLLERLGEYGVRDLARPEEDRVTQFIDSSLYRRRANDEETLEFLSPSQRSLWQHYSCGQVFDHETDATFSDAVQQHLLDLQVAETSLNQHRDHERELTAELKSRRRAISDLERRRAALTVDVNEKQATITGQDRTIQGLQTTIGDHKKTIGDHEKTIGDHEKTIGDHEKTIGDHEKTIGDHEKTIGDHEKTIGDHEKTIGDHEKTIGDHEKTIGDHEKTIGDHEKTIKALSTIVEARDTTIRNLLGSTSWRVTTPLRVVSRAIRWYRRTLRRALKLTLWMAKSTFSRSSPSSPLVPGRNRGPACSFDKNDDCRDPSPTLPELIREAQEKHLQALSQLTTSRSQTSRAKISIIAWDMGHNPLGRAYLLADMLRDQYDVEITGALFPRYGTELWEPLRSCNRITMKYFTGTDFPEHFTRMEEVANQIDGDIIYISKPRLPSVELAILAKLHRNRPVILDVDDYELSFFRNPEPLTLEQATSKHGSRDYNRAHAETWTRYCASLVPLFDHITVSNEELQKRYGGTILPHARCEHDFDPTAYPRDEIRAALGYSPEDRVILFAGTLRMHKGVERIVRAVKKLRHLNCKLMIVGTPPDRETRQFLRTIDNETVKHIPDVPFHDLPGYLSAGDLVCLLQDTKALTSQFQMPAKFTDALAMGLPVLASNAPPLVNLARDGLVELVGDGPLERKIEDCFSDYSAYRKRSLENRDYFLRRYSYSSCTPRMTELIDRLLAQPPSPIPSEFRNLLDHHRGLFTEPNKPSTTRNHSLTVHPPHCDGAHRNRTTASCLSPSRERSVRAFVDDRVDVVFFWKQNDTGIYGRRQDMLIKYLAQDSRIHRIFHFDAPANLLRIANEAARTLRAPRRSHARLVLFNTIKRRYMRDQWTKVRHDTYVYFDTHRSSKLRTWLLPSAKDYVTYLQRVLEHHSVGERRVLFWVCPNNFHFPSIERKFQPDLIVADVIDDQRKWDIPMAHRNKLEQNYKEILGRCDLVFVNCDSVLRSMRQFTDNIHVFPNAAETLEKEARSWKKPPELARMKGPIIGYVGNLDIARIDLPLLEMLATYKPDWNLVLIGSMHRGREIDKLNRYRNVHFLGVRVYEKALRYVKFFDVAVIPHLDNELTRSMNPLKLYVYVSLQVPVVTTAIENIQDFGQFVRLGRSPEEFIRLVDQCLQQEVGSTERERLERLLITHSWRRRVNEMMDLIEDKFSEMTDGVRH